MIIINNREKYRCCGSGSFKHLGSILGSILSTLAMSDNENELVNVLLTCRSRTSDTTHAVQLLKAGVDAPILSSACRRIWCSYRYYVLVQACDNGHDYLVKLLCSYCVIGDDIRLLAAKAAHESNRTSLRRWLELTHTWTTPLHYLDILTSQRTVALLSAGVDPCAHATLSPQAKIARGVEVIITKPGDEREGQQGIVTKINSKKKGAKIDFRDGTLGLKWKDVGTARPWSGTWSGTKLLNNAKLSEALTKKQEFTQAEWDAFGIKALTVDHFIIASGKYFEPDDGKSLEGLLFSSFKLIDPPSSYKLACMQRIVAEGSVAALVILEVDGWTSKNKAMMAEEVRARAKKLAWIGCKAPDGISGALWDTLVIPRVLWLEFFVGENVTQNDLWSGGWPRV